jgi:hypothetical protein
MPQLLCGHEPLLPRRHAHHRILFQQRREAVDVSVLPRVNIAIEEGALRIARQYRNPRGASRHPLFECHPRTLQRAVDGGDRRIEKSSALDGRPSQHIVQQQGGALARREKLNRGDEG